MTPTVIWGLLLLLLPPPSQTVNLNPPGLRVFQRHVSMWPRSVALRGVVSSLLPFPSVACPSPAVPHARTWHETQFAACQQCVQRRRSACVCILSRSSAFGEIVTAESTGEGESLPMLLRLLEFLPNSEAFSIQFTQRYAPQTLCRWQVWSFSSVLRRLECLITSER